MDRLTAFQMLEIEPTHDKKMIKRAYAALVKKYHPEEQPEKWKEIHDAYETAIAYSEKTVIWEEEKPIEDAQLEKEGFFRAQSESEELEEAFDNLSELKQKAEKQEEENQKAALKKALKKLDELEVCQKYNDKLWEDFFLSEVYRQACFLQDFLYAWGAALENIEISEKLAVRMHQELRAAAEKYNDSSQCEKQRMLLNPVEYTAMRIEGARRRKTNGEGSGGSAAFIVTLCVVIVFFLIAATSKPAKITKDTNSQEVIEKINGQRTGLIVSNKQIESQMLQGFYNNLPDMDAKQYMEFLKYRISLDKGVKLLDYDHLYQSNEEEAEGYKLVHSEIPEEMQQYLGEGYQEENAAAFYIETPGESAAAIVFCEPGEFGLDDTKTEVYLYQEYGYVKLEETELMGDELVFMVNMYFADEEPYPIVLVEK